MGTLKSQYGFTKNEIVTPHLTIYQSEETSILREKFYTNLRRWKNWFYFSTNTSASDWKGPLSRACRKCPASAPIAKVNPSDLAWSRCISQSLLLHARDYIWLCHGRVSPPIERRFRSPRLDTFDQDLYRAKLKRAKAHVGWLANIVLNLLVQIFCLALRLRLSR